MSSKQQSDFDIQWDINWDTNKEIDTRRRTGDLKGYDATCVAYYRRAKIERLLYKRYKDDKRFLRALSHRSDAWVITGMVKESCPAGTVEKLRAEVPY